jgi:hypothetical protein
MWTVLLCVLFGILGGVLGALFTRGRHPAPVIMGMAFGAMVGLAPLGFAQAMLAARTRQPGLLARVGRYIEALRDGEPVIWAATVVLLVIALVILAVWYKTAREFRREEEARTRRQGSSN